MNIKFNTVELKEIVKQLEKVNKSKDNPYIRIKTKDNGFMLGVSDGMVTLEKHIVADSEGGNVDFQVNKNVFIGLVKKVRGDVITLHKTEKTVVFACGETKVKLPHSEEITKYISTENENGESEVKLDAKMVLAALNKVAYAADFTGENIQYAGVLWHFANEELRFVATDRFRLAYSTIENDTEYNELKFLFPIFPLETLKSIIKDTDADELGLYYAGSKVFVNVEGYIYAVLLPGVDLFDYERVVFVNNEVCRIKVKRGKFLQDISVSEVVSEGPSGEKAVVLAAKTHIHLSMKNENGSLETITPAEVEGEFIPQMVGFYPSNIADVLKRADTDNIFINIEDEKRPMVIREDNSEISWRALVMPVVVGGTV